MGSRRDRSGCRAFLRRARPAGRKFARERDRIRSREALAAPTPNLGVLAGGRSRRARRRAPRPEPTDGSSIC